MLYVSHNSIKLGDRGEEQDSGLTAVFGNYGDGLWIHQLKTFYKIIYDVFALILTFISSLYLSLPLTVQRVTSLIV